MPVICCRCSTPPGSSPKHRAVREQAGIFDVSHMGEVLLEGPDAVRNLEHLLTNRFADLKLGSCRYALMLYDNGGTVDDLIVTAGTRTNSCWSSTPPTRIRTWPGYRSTRRGRAPERHLRQGGPRLPSRVRARGASWSAWSTPELLPDKYYTFSEYVGFENTHSP